MNLPFHAVFDGFTINSEHGLSSRDHGNIDLTPKELAALSLLIQHSGQLVTKEELIRVVWNGQQVSDMSIARCISVIKSRLKRCSPGYEAPIKTEYGRGYRFVGEVEVHPSVFVTPESFSALINSTSDFIAVKDGKGRWLKVNQSGIELFDLWDKPWQGKTDLELADLSPLEFREGFLACIASDEKAWQAGKPTASREVVCCYQTERIFEVVKTPLLTPTGERNLLVIMGRDVTAQVRAEEQARLSAMVFANSQEAVVITDAENRILSVNRAFTLVTGYSEEEVLGQNPRIFASGRHPVEFYRVMWQQIDQEGTWRGEIWDRRKNGEIYPKWLDISAVHDDDGRLTNYIAIFSDISERKAAEEQLQFMAYHDPLTRLPNRFLLRDRFNQAIAIAGRDSSFVALLFLDLDQFKTVNDTLGHEIGDQLLLAVAERLNDCVRETDTVSRLGGDEFAVLLTSVQDVGVVAKIAQKILDRLMDEFHVDDRLLITSSSIGIGLFPNDCGDFDTMLKLAEAAMYDAKNSGRNTYRFYTEQMNVNALERLHMQSDLRQALKLGEFLLYYQPQFDLKNGRLVGVEALIRWNRADDQFVPPGKFIPIAEATGLIVPIGEWVLREACRQHRAWMQMGFEPFVVAVNISALQFRRGNIVETILDTLRETGMNAQHLELELTESILIHEVEQVLEVIRKLKAIGLRLSIDDFGTGYSSLTYLKRFAVDKLKIDQSFVRNLPIDEDDITIAQSIIQLGHSLKLQTIAEGVETREQAEFLEQAGCDEVQGYYFSRPLPASELEQLLRRKQVEALIK
jgi:diguanylate cyclase (GGDEF)-like protein/PAS domain S-box-containing protein